MEKWGTHISHSQMWSLNYKKNERKENSDSVMAKLNLLVFLHLRKGRGETKGWGRDKTAINLDITRGGEKGFLQ